MKTGGKRRVGLDPYPEEEIGEEEQKEKVGGGCRRNITVQDSMDKPLRAASGTLIACRDAEDAFRRVWGCRRIHEIIDQRQCHSDACYDCKAPETHRGYDEQPPSVI